MLAGEQALLAIRIAPDSRLASAEEYNLILRRFTNHALNFPRLHRDLPVPLREPRLRGTTPEYCHPLYG